MASPVSTPLILSVSEEASFGSSCVKGTEMQLALGSEDSARASYTDTAASASAGPCLVRPSLITALTPNAASAAFAWLTHPRRRPPRRLGSRLGRHAVTRAERRTLTLAAPDTSEESRVVRLTVENAAIVSVEYEVGVAVVLTIMLATGGYTASPISSRAQHILDLLAVATNSVDHALAPTPLSPQRSLPRRCARSRRCRSFVDPAYPGTKMKSTILALRRADALPRATTKVKFLAVQTLRGAGSCSFSMLVHATRPVCDVERRGGTR
ncbi:hypothetical protein MSAN_00778900 [Mycena sanguinolenta]|uniref:Uncharacterized protein n=1 Tax=Mycena sanguinolenta TaxID=230812 RepID=A0A8H6Z7V4_9AGAR|nr:hypothetical protein MSAN_00778900 [Mycena sanguinolenta]